MKLPVLKSPIAGMPDGEIQLPSKPVRLTLQPVEAVALYTALEALGNALEPAAKTPQHHALMQMLDDIQARLLDRLEVTFP